MSFKLLTTDKLNEERNIVSLEHRATFYMQEQ